MERRKIASLFSLSQDKKAGRMTASELTDSTSIV